MYTVLLKSISSSCCIDLLYIIAAQNLATLTALQVATIKFSSVPLLGYVGHMAHRLNRNCEICLPLIKYLNKIVPICKEIYELGTIIKIDENSMANSAPVEIIVVIDRAMNNVS